MPAKKRKIYLGPNVDPAAPLPRTSKWRYEKNKLSAGTGSVATESERARTSRGACSDQNDLSQGGTSSMQSQDLQHQQSHRHYNLSDLSLLHPPSPQDSSASENDPSDSDLEQQDQDGEDSSSSDEESNAMNDDNEDSPDDNWEQESVGEDPEDRDNEDRGGIRNPEGPPNYATNPSHSKLRRKIDGDFNPVIDLAVNVSRSDILYMVLGLARREHYSNVALSNAVKLINAVFVSNVLPPSIDALDGLLVSDCGVKYFFFCSSCTSSFGELNRKIVKHHICPNCGTNNVISDLRVAHFFVIFDIPHQLQNLLGNQKVVDSLLSPSEAILKSRGAISDIWDGSVYRAFAAAVAQFNCRVFSFHFNVDGTPLVASSKCSIWPIQLALNELPPELRVLNLLLAGLWFGKMPAKMDLFLVPFTSHFSEISEGFNIKIKNVVELARAYCIGSCVDSGARGKVQGIKTHSGYYSCNWCVICGEWIGGAVRFPVRLECPRSRTHEELLRHQNALMGMDPMLEAEEDPLEDPGIPEDEQDLQGVNAVSPLINMPYFGQGVARTPSFNLVSSFYVDSMHNLDLGLSKYFLGRWMEDYNHEHYIKDSEVEINQRIESLRPPKEFRRKPRKLDERARFNARESQNWMMFCCVPVLTGILADKFLKVWLHLIQAIYLLSCREISHQDLNIADTLINYFIIKTQEYYGEQDMTFNMHIIKHMALHTYCNGPLWATNAYCFEDGNGRLKKVIHSAQGIPHQIIRALSWEESFKILEGHVSQKAKDYVTEINLGQLQKQRSFVVGSARLLGKSISTQLTPEECHQCEIHHHNENNLECYPKVITKNCLFTDCNRSSRWDNSIAQLVDKNVVVIRKIFYDRDLHEIFLLVSDINFETILVPPAGVHLHKDSHFMRSITSIDEELRYIRCSDLDIVCFRASMPHGDFLAPLPNVFNRQ